MRFRSIDGLAGGLIAGMVMAMVAMLYALVAEGDLLAPLKQMGALFFAADPATPLSVAAGLMLHMVTAAVFGLLFVALARTAIPGTWPPRALGTVPVAAAALAYILIEWVIASYVILPKIDPPLLATFASLGGVVAHAMYGIVLGWWVVARAQPVVIHPRERSRQQPAA